ncbi:glutathione S-transferase domain protein [Scytonema sp. HK-05]|uniref:hypothetical protein n=1 Tax=Scytonema sp. HK-05 TaxID=1137095 RepID=UPI0009364704|nr:hypothetical protein [Scytonema sp. HK-05]OKH51455.1 hypothetical protein NIES2130_33825 [Scytonema sp. HK-05]BAY48300.1 glutathione S-transferase domain protein [Scytonema sp. HK-05]
MGAAGTWSLFTVHCFTYRVQLDAVYKKYAEAVFALPGMQQWLNAASDEQKTISGYELTV